VATCSDGGGGRPPPSAEKGEDEGIEHAAPSEPCVDDRSAARRCEGKEEGKSKDGGARNGGAGRGQQAEAQGDRVKQRGDEGRLAAVEQVLGRNHTEVEHLVKDILQLATPDTPAETTVVEYISTVLRDGLGEEEASDLRDGVMGVAPELQQVLPPGSFELLLARASQICENKRCGEQDSQDMAVTRKGPISGFTSAPAIQFTLRTNAPSDGESDGSEEEADDADDEDEANLTPRRRQLREIFPGRPLVDLRTAVELSGGKLEEAIEKMFAIQDFEAMSISSDAVIEWLSKCGRDMKRRCR